MAKSIWPSRDAGTPPKDAFGSGNPKDHPLPAPADLGPVPNAGQPPAPQQKLGDPDYRPAKPRIVTGTPGQVVTYQVRKIGRCGGDGVLEFAASGTSKDARALVSAGLLTQISATGELT